MVDRTNRRTRVLHITNWYPNVLEPGGTPFIRRHVEALEHYCENEVWHVEVRQRDTRGLVRDGLHADRTRIQVTPQKHWYIIEWLTTIHLLRMWSSRNRSRKYDMVNIHIAYPLAVHFRLLRCFIDLPIVITEHWTAYHFNFHSNSSGLQRIRNIFGHRIPMICVSNTLADDIERFAGKGKLPIAVVDNVVDTAHFRYDKTIEREPGRFFAIASWRAVKRSDVLIETIIRLREKGVDARLRIAGGGARLPEMKQAIARAGLVGQIELLGQLGPEEVALEMKKAHALLHCSEYETYSVVCAESLCCGTPVIVSDLEAVKEYLEPDMGVIVEGMDSGKWAERILDTWETTLTADRGSISRRMSARANAKDVGRRYFELLEAVRANKGILPEEMIRQTNSLGG